MAKVTKEKSNVTQFQEKVYSFCSKIPEGKVATYGDLAHAMGNAAYRAVGRALNKNPFAPEVPCHRVVASDGTIGGFASGTKNKIAILKSEGVIVKNDMIVNFRRIRHKF